MLYFFWNLFNFFRTMSRCTWKIMLSFMMIRFSNIMSSLGISYFMWKICEIIFWINYNFITLALDIVIIIINDVILDILVLRMSLDWLLTTMRNKAFSRFLLCFYLFLFAICLTQIVMLVLRKVWSCISEQTLERLLSCYLTIDFQPFCVH